MCWGDGALASSVEGRQVPRDSERLPGHPRKLWTWAWQVNRELGARCLFCTGRRGWVLGGVTLVGRGRQSEEDVPEAVTLAGRPSREMGLGR